MNQFFENEARSLKSEPQPHSNNPFFVNRLIGNQHYNKSSAIFKSHSCVIKNGGGEMIKSFHIGDDLVQDDEKKEKQE